MKAYKARKKYENITIFDNGEIQENKPVYEIINNKTKHCLGFIYYYKSYEQYIFSSNESKVFGISCLKNVIDFMEKIK
jgi:DNA-binding ferritin-like protein (Dps family)